MSLEEVFEKLSSSQKGLSSAEAKERLQKYGYNEIQERKVSPVKKFLGYFCSPIPWMIEAASYHFSNNQPLGRFLDNYCPLTSECGSSFLAVITMCTPSAILDYNKLAEVIVEISKKYGKTMRASLMGQDEGLRNKEILADGRIPYYNYAEEAIRSLKAMLRFAEWLKLPEGRIAKFDVNKNQVQELLRRVRDEGRSTLLQEEGMKVLKAYGIPIPLGKIAKTEDEAVMIAKDVGFPVVMKISSPQILHKSDAGGVRVNIKTGEEARDTFVQITRNVKQYNPNAEINGILVQEMVADGKETIIGSKQEPGFGAVVMFGMGGIYVQFLKDVVFSVTPFTDLEASRMISSITTSQVLQGVRGEKPSDIRKLAECIQRISQLATDFPQIKELDLNPTVVFEEGKGCKVVDVRIGLS